jgi:hypothetical protein
MLFLGIKSLRSAISLRESVHLQLSRLSRWSIRFIGNDKIGVCKGNGFAYVEPRPIDKIVFTYRSSSTRMPSIISRIVLCAITIVPYAS